MIMGTESKVQFIPNTLLAVLTAFIVVACASINLAGYDQQAYENASSLKAEVDALVGKIGTGSGSYL